MIPLSSQTEALIKAKAKASGKSPDEIVREALSQSGALLTWRRPSDQPAVGTKEEFFAALDEIAARSAARPVIDPRSSDEIIGYDDFGLPR